MSEYNHLPCMRKILYPVHSWPADRKASHALVLLMPRAELPMGRGCPLPLIRLARGKTSGLLGIPFGGSL